jgi:glycosyltransferase involved in cell wall biosynthesis
MIIDALARGYAAVGHEVLLCTTGDSTCPVERRWVYERAQGTHAEASVELQHVMHAYAAAADVDIVHDHTRLGPAYPACSTDTPVVVTNHGPFDDSFEALYRSSSVQVPIIAISYSHARGAPTDLPVAKIIRHGVDVAAFPFCVEPDDYSLFLGRMSPTKGAHRAARIAREIGERLVIAAKMREEEERCYFEDQVRPLLNRDVVYVGEVDHDEKVGLLVHARALINPIQWPEPFGLVMVEALACGTPVLAFPCGAAPEIIQDDVTGFLCSGEADMADKIDQIARLDRRACRASVQDVFSTERMVAEHLQLYETLLVRESAVA